MKNLLISLVLLIVSNYIYSQNSITIKGVIYDATDNLTIGGVHIYPKEFATGTFTEDDGVFEIQLPKTLRSDTLVISCIGYKTEKIKISEIKSEEIYLTQNETMLAEIAIVSEYQPKKILQKAYKNIKNNFPYKESYSAKANFREYTKKNDKTIHFFELYLDIKDKGFAYNPSKSSSVEIEEVFSLINNDVDFYYWASSYFWHWGSKGYIDINKLKKERYIVDSITYIETDKIMHITYIPPVKKEITYEGGKIGVYDFEVDSVVTYYDSTLQYNTKHHYVINMTNYAILNLSKSFIRFSKPNKNNIFENEFVLTEQLINFTFKKRGDKYFPESIVTKTKMDVYQNKKFDKVAYKIVTFKELLVTEINENPVEDKITPNRYMGLDEFENEFKPMSTRDTVLECFDDEIRKHYFERLEVE